MQRSHAALCLLAVAILVACTRNGPRNSLFESARYHARDGKVYYLHAFPCKAFEIDDADAATCTALDSTYGRDESHVFINGLPLPGADVATFKLLDRPGFAKDRDHVFQRDRAISDDPAHFELLDGELAKDSHAVYWSDGSVLSEDPTHFAIVSPDRARQRKPHPRSRSLDIPSPARGLARDSQHVFYFDQPIVEAELSSFRSLDGPYASDSAHVYWMGKAIDGADEHLPGAERELRVLNRRPARLLPADGNRQRRSETFPPDKAVTNCSETSISFAE